MAQWLERRRHNNFFLLTWVQFPPRLTSKSRPLLHFLPFLGYKSCFNTVRRALHEEIHSKSNIYIFWKYMTFFMGFIMAPATSMSFGNWKKYAPKCPIGYLMTPRWIPIREKIFLWAKIALENIAHVSKVLGACMIPFLRVAHCPKKFSVPSKTSVAQWLERR